MLALIEKLAFFQQTVVKVYYNLKTSVDFSLDDFFN